MELVALVELIPELEELLPVEVEVIPLEVALRELCPVEEVVVERKLAEEEPEQRLVELRQQEPAMLPLTRERLEQFQQEELCLLQLEQVRLRPSSSMPQPLATRFQRKARLLRVICTRKLEPRLPAWLLRCASSRLAWTPKESPSTALLPVRAVSL